MVSHIKISKDRHGSLHRPKERVEQSRRNSKDKRGDVMRARKVNILSFWKQFDSGPEAKITGIVTIMNFILLQLLNKAIPHLFFAFVFFFIPLS